MVWFRMRIQDYYVGAYSTMFSSICHTVISEFFAAAARRFVSLSDSLREVIYCAYQRVVSVSRLLNFTMNRLVTLAVVNLKCHCTQGNAVPAHPVIEIQRSHTSNFIKRVPNHLLGRILAQSWYKVPSPLIFHFNHWTL